MRAILLVIFLALIVGCPISTVPEAKPPPEIAFVWQWDPEIIYAEGDICWLSRDPNTGKPMDWQSLQDNNLGHRPVMYGTDPYSPEWWQRIR